MWKGWLLWVLIALGCWVTISLFCCRMGKKTALKSGEWKIPGVKTVVIKVKQCTVTGTQSLNLMFGNREVNRGKAGWFVTVSKQCMGNPWSQENCQVLFQLIAKKGKWLVAAWLIAFLKPCWKHDLWHPCTVPPCYDKHQQPKKSTCGSTDTRFLHQLAFLLMAVSACLAVHLERIGKLCRAVAILAWHMDRHCGQNMSHSWAVAWKLLLVAPLLSTGMAGGVLFCCVWA